MSWRAAEAAFDDEVTGRITLPRMFLDAVDRHADRPAQAYRYREDRCLTPGILPAPAPDTFETIEYTEFGNVVRALAAGFADLGVSPGDRVAVFADTRMEWAQVDFALLAAGAIVTTVYAGSSARRVRSLLEDSGATGLVVGRPDLLETGLEATDSLDTDFVVAMDRPGEGLPDRGDVHGLDAIHDRGSAADPGTVTDRVDAIDPDDLASIIYTSGTTGRPKGVGLTHWNFKANVDQCRARFGPRPDRPNTPAIDADSRAVSFLPLAHVFERLAGHFLMFASGALVAYAESPDTLREDFAAIGPTTGTSVPRVYERIYAAIREEASGSPISERVFRWATAVGRRYAESPDPGPLLAAKHRLADVLVFRRVRAALGGEIDFLISGGGSLSAELCTLYHGMGLPILEGYGLTETAPVVAANPPEAPRIGTIGPPVRDLDVRLDPSVVRDGTFDVDGEVGELVVQGPNVVDGYWNAPAETEAAFEDGWFRTGDIVARDDDGYITFLERAKELLVLSTGKNVAPGPIEDAFATSEYVEQCMLVGEDRKFVGALVVPAADAIRDWAADAGVDVPETRDAMCRDDRVRELVETEIDRINEDLEYDERIKRFELVPDEFTQENGLLTPTLKKKRREILERYADAVARIYDVDAP